MAKGRWKRSLKQRWARLVCAVRGHQPLLLKWRPPRYICRRCNQSVEGEN